MVKGFHIPSLPFDNLIFVGDLLFREYPSTRVYADKDNIPHILEWVDVDEAGADEFFIFRSSKSLLKKYIDQSISHLDLIDNAEGRTAIFFQGSLEQSASIRCVSIDSIDPQYLPSSDSYFNPDNSDDIAIIKKHFELSNYSSPDEDAIENSIVADRLINYAKDSGNDLFRLHLNTGKFVSHGKVRTDILGATLLKFEDLYHELAEDHVKGKDRTKKLNSKETLEFKNTSNTEVVLKNAASFEVYIKSRGPQQMLFDIDRGIAISQGEKIFQNVMEVIHNSSDPELIGVVKDKYNPNVFAKLRDFADHIKKTDLDVDLDYYSNSTRQTLTEKVDIKFANNILTTLLNASARSEPLIINIKGKFDAINCSTGHFVLKSNDDEEFYGYFDEAIMGSVPLLTFTDYYDISISRTELKSITDPALQYTDVIIATYIIK